MATMKIQKSLQIIFTAVPIALLTACATAPTSAPAALAGTWTTSLTTAWTINADGTFHVTATKPNTEIWGTCTVAGDTVPIQETRRSTAAPKPSNGPSLYTLV